MIRAASVSTLYAHATMLATHSHGRLSSVVGVPKPPGVRVVMSVVHNATSRRPSDPQVQSR